MKKRIWIVLPLFLLAVICPALHFTVNPTIVRSTGDAAAKEIAESWLQKQISLQDYEVIDAHFMELRHSQDAYVAMTYSVKPRKYAVTDWYVGNGETGEDGWLIEKSGMITYRMIGPIAVTGIDCNTGP